jgi:AsmA family protein
MDGKVKKATWGVAVVLGALLLALVTAALVLQSPWFRGWLEQQASEQLGRDVGIGGHGIDWGLPLTLRLDDVRVANAPWAEGPMARLDELRVTLDVGRLVRGEIELGRVELQRPELFLVRREDGTTNLDDLLDEAATEGQEMPLWPEAFTIDRGRGGFHDESLNAEIEVAFDTPGESVEELSVNLRGAGHFQGDQVELQGLLHLDVEERRGAIEAFEASIGESRMEGLLAFDLGRDVPWWQAELEADALDLERWGLLAERREEAGPGEGEWDQGLAQALDGLAAFEAELSLSLGRLSYAGQTLHDLAAEAALEDGRLTIARLQAHQQLDREQPRTLDVQGWLEADGERLAGHLQSQWDRVDLTAALAPFGLGEVGTLHGNLDVQIVDGGLLPENTALDYHAPQWELELSLTADSRTEGVEGHRVHLVGEGFYEQELVHFDLLVGPLLDLTDPDAAYPVSGELASSDTQLWIDGSAVQPFALQAVEGNARLEGPSPADLTDLTGINLPELPPYQVSGYIRYRSDLLNIDGLEGTFGDSDVSGDVRIRFGEPPTLWATLVTRQLESTDLLPMLGMAPEDEAGETASPEQQQWSAEDERAERLFADREWDLEALRNTDIVLEYEAANVQAEHVPFEDLVLALELEEGIMTVKPLEVGLGGGLASASWVLDARQPAIEGDIQLALDQVNLAAILDEAGLPEVARDTLGVFGGRGDLRYRGRSMHEVMAGLDGELELAMSQGWLDIIAAELLPLNVANALVAALTGEDQVQLECTYLQFVADDGLVDLAEFFMATEIAHFEGAGAINLATERMDMAFQGHNIDPTLFTGNSPVELQGSLRDPEVNVITQELIARGALSLLGAIAAPPLAILPWVDPGGGEEVGMGCERALSEFEE